MNARPHRAATRSLSIGFAIALGALMFTLVTVAGAALFAGNIVGRRGLVAGVYWTIYLRPRARP
jgi:hypothetical protein